MSIIPSLSSVLHAELPFFKLEKLTIVSHTNKKRNGPGETFEVMFNPESYSLSYENVYSRKQGINTSGREAQYSMSKPERLKLKLVMDGTGVDLFGVEHVFKSYDVNKEIDRFLKLTSYMNGKIHEPKYLTLKWGDLIFKCRLGSVQVTYSLFGRSGIPLRAELDTEFFGDLEESERLKKEDKNSPDLTHYRIVEAHDELPLMCESIYGSSRYYVYVAKANNLDDFRNLEPGQEIYFPPIEK